MLAFFLHDFSPFIVKFGNGFGLRWYGLAYVLAFLIGYALFRYLARRGYNALTPQQVSDFITGAAVFGVIIGGRIGWALIYGRHMDHLEDPWFWPLQVWKGGMSSHGGILGLALFTLVYARWNKLSWTSIGDSLVTVAPVGLFLVRCANFINGELWGKEAQVPWAVQFPTELPEHPDLARQFAEKFPALLDHLDGVEDLVRQAQHSLLNPFAHIDPELAAALRQVLPPRHPSQIYEALLEGVVLFLILWTMRTRMRLPRGVITGAFFILYAVLRIIGEVFRVPDSAFAVGRLSAGQYLSLYLIAIGAAFVAWGLKAQQYDDPADAANGETANGAQGSG